MGMNAAKINECYIIIAGKWLLSNIQLLKIMKISLTIVTQVSKEQKLCLHLK